MNTDIINYELKMIGITIGYHRSMLAKENKNFHKHNFLKEKSKAIIHYCNSCSKNKCKQSHNICSINTLVNIENGKLSKTTCYYIDFSTKLGYKYKLNKNLAKERILIEKTILECIDTNDVNKLLSSYKTITECLHKYKSYIYYSDIYYIYKLILNYLLDRLYPTSNDIILMEYLMPYLNESTLYLVKYICFQYYTKILPFDSPKLTEMEHELYKLRPQNIEIMLRVLEKEEKHLDIFLRLHKLNISVLSPYESYQFHQFLAFISLNLGQFKFSLKELLMCNNLIEQNSFRLPKNNIILHKMRLGIVYYYNKDYNNAILHFEKVFEYSPDMLRLNLFLFIESLVLTNQIGRLKELLSLNPIPEMKYKSIYLYYRMKFVLNSTYQDLEKYIIDHFLPILPKNSEYYKIIKNDLLIYCKKTRDYKILFDFEDYYQKKYSS